MSKVFLYIGILFVLLMAMKLLFKKIEIILSKHKKEDGDWSAFFLRKEIMNEKEKNLFKILSENLGTDFLIFSKVRVEDFIGVDGKGLNYVEKGGKRNRIKSYHVDFLICEKETTRPLMVIELDGSSHQRLDRIERDNRFDQLYKKMGLNFEHIKTGSDFEEEVNKIKERLITNRGTDDIKMIVG